MLSELDLLLDVNRRLDEAGLENVMTNADQSRSRAIRAFAFTPAV